MQKLKRAIEIGQGIDSKPELLLLKAFIEWKRLGIKLSLEKLLQQSYSRTQICLSGYHSPNTLYDEYSN